MRKFLLFLLPLFLTYITDAQIKTATVEAQQSFKLSGITYKRIPNVANSIQEMQQVSPIIGNTVQWNDSLQGGLFTLYAKAGFTVDSSLIFSHGDTNYVLVRDQRTKEIQVEWFKRQNEKDWYNAFKRMYRYIGLRGGGVAINLKPGYTYNIDTIQIYVGAKDTTNGVITDIGNNIRGLELRNVSDVTINGNGATISVKGNFKRKATVAAGGGRYVSYFNSVVPLVISDSKNITIRSLNLTGNVQQMTMDATVVEGDSYGLKLQGVQTCNIINLNSSNFATDGMLTDVSPYTHHSSKDINVTNGVFEHNGRQGLTVAGQLGGVYTNCHFSFSGDSLGTYYGHAPRAGVDIEPSIAANDAPYCGDISFINCVFEGNVGTGITAALAIDRNIYVEGGVIDNRLHNNSQVAIMGIYNFTLNNVNIYTGTGNIYPVWGIGKGQMSKLENLTIHSNSSGIIAAVDAEYGCTINRIKLYGEHTTPLASYFPYINSGNVTWTNNYVFMDSSMWGGNNRALVQYVAFAENNTYASNLDTSDGKYFTASFDQAKTVRGENLPLNGSVRAYDAPNWPLGTKYSHGTTSVGEAIKLNSSGKAKTITYGNGIPTSNYYEAGSIIIMNNPITAGYSYYQCKTSGTAGVDAVFQGYGAVAGNGRTFQYLGDYYRTLTQITMPDTAIYNTGFGNDTGMVLLKIPLGFSIASLRTYTGEINVRGKGHATWTVSLTSAGTVFYQPVLNIEGDSSLLNTKVRLLRDVSNNAYIGFFDITSVIPVVTSIDVTAVSFASAADASLTNASKAWSATVVRSLSGYTVLNLLSNHSAALWATMPDKPNIVLTDTNAIKNYNVLIGDSANNRFNKGNLIAGTNITLTKTTAGITVNSNYSYTPSVQADLSLLDNTLLLSGNYNGSTARTIGLNLGLSNSWTGAKTTFSAAATTTANNGTLNVGGGAFDGTTTGFFSGSSGGTLIAANSLNSFTGRLADLQVGGNSKFFTNASGLGYFAYRLGINNTNPQGLLQLSGSSTNSATFSTTGMGLVLDGGPFTSTSSSGTIALGAAHSIAVPGMSASSATTLTDAPTLYIAGSPSAGANMTFTNPHALYIGGGNVYMGANSTKLNVNRIGVGQNAYNTGSLSSAGSVFTVNVNTITDVTSAASATNGFGSIAGIARDTVAAANTAVTYTKLSSFNVLGSPIAGTNIIITRPIALNVAAGETSLAGLSTGYRASGTNTTLTASDNLLEVTATGLTITLPDATLNVGREYVIKLTVAGTTTISTSLSQLIDGVATYTLSVQYKYVHLKSNGTGYLVTANN